MKYTCPRANKRKVFSFSVMSIELEGNFFGHKVLLQPGWAVYPLLLERAQEMELPCVSDPWLADEMSEDIIFGDVCCKGEQKRVGERGTPS
jgi:hypothetical protein